MPSPATNLIGRLQGASFDDQHIPKTDTFGNIVRASADYGKDGAGQSVRFYDAFFLLSWNDQKQVVAHEAMHLIFSFGDADLATAAGVYEGDKNASANFQKELRKHCK